jgi:hypothetical protein
VIQCALMTEKSLVPATRWHSRAARGPKYRYSKDMCTEPMLASSIQNTTQETGNLDREEQGMLDYVPVYVLKYLARHDNRNKTINLQTSEATTYLIIHTITLEQTHFNEPYGANASSFEQIRAPTRMIPA